MIFTLPTLFIISLIRAVVANQYNLDPQWDAHIGFLISDIIFFLFVVGWFIKKAERKVTPSVIFYFVAFLGSMVWDYQEGFYFLKFLVFPGVFYVLLNQKQFNNASIFNAIKYSFPILFDPIGSLRSFFSDILLSKKIQSQQKDTDTHSDFQFSLSKAIWFGVGLGILILLFLAALDPDFANFLRISEWWEIIAKSFLSLIFYVFVFFWYFWQPVHAKWTDEEKPSVMSTMLHRAVVMIVGIFVGYAFYDSYIVLRVFKLIKLTFETIGKNAQMNFLELVIMGGAWLFLVVYLLNRIKERRNENKSVRTIFMLLLLSSMWLIPPMLNIMRVLLNVYIPEFGLTARRLFGIYTTVGFLASFIVIFYGVATKMQELFSKVVITFFLTVLFLSFVNPTNLLIANWHFSRYIQNDTKADYDYFKKLRLEKWGWIFLQQLDTEQYKSDNLWGVLLAARTHNPELQKQYADNIVKGATDDIDEVKGKVQKQEFQQIASKFGNNQYWSVQESLSPVVEIQTITSTFSNSDEKFLRENLTSPRLVSRAGDMNSIMSAFSVMFDYRYRSAVFTQPAKVVGTRTYTNPNGTTTTTIETDNSVRKSQTLVFELNKSRVSNSTLALQGSAAPFIVRDLGNRCNEKRDFPSGRCFYFSDLCTQYKTRTGKDLVSPVIPKEFTTLYFNRQEYDSFCDNN
jgi:hypothetical protein